jgi:hypothetical protein
MRGTAVYGTGGETLELTCELGWVGELLDGAVEPAPGSVPRPAPTMCVRIEAATQAFPRLGLSPLARHAWSRGSEVVMEDVGGSGFDMRLVVTNGRPEFIYRWRPDATRAAARRLLPARFVLLAREILIQYPVMWWASVQGRAPLHAVACTVGDAVYLLAGPGGVGKSTLLKSELQDGARATSDNLCVADGRTVWGLVEPMRIEGGSGRRVTNGRVEVPLQGRTDHLVPDQVIVVRRTEHDDAMLIGCDPAVACRSLVTGTYAAGELSRFWGFSATAALGSGLGPAHPPVTETAGAFASRLRCSELLLPRRTGTRLGEVVNRMEAIA